MLTFELIRIDEVNNANKEEENFPSFYFSYSKEKENEEYNRKMTLLEQKINSSYDKNLFTNTDYDLSKPLMISKKSSEIEEKNFKKFKTNSIKKSYLSTNIKLFSYTGKTKFENFNNIEDKDLDEDNKYVSYVNKFIKGPVNSKNLVLIK